MRGTSPHDQSRRVGKAKRAHDFCLLEKDRGRGASAPLPNLRVRARGEILLTQASSFLAESLPSPARGEGAFMCISLAAESATDPAPRSLRSAPARSSDA